MKKIILLIFLAFSSLQFALAEEITNQAALAIPSISNESTDNSDEPEPIENYKLHPKNHKSFGISIESQIKLMAKLLEKNGKREVIRYFLSLKNHNNQKAIDLLSHNDNPDLKLVILENLPISVFSEIISSLFSETGGRAKAHWGYKTSDKCEEKTFLTPPSRAQQYINFFMSHNTLIKASWVSNESRNQEISKARGKKIAKVLNTFDEDTLITLLYGRPDTRFIDEDNAIVKGQPSSSSYYYYKIQNTDYFYIKYRTSYDGKLELVYLNEDEFSRTALSRVHQIDYIILHLSPNLIVAIFTKELEKDKQRLPALIKTIGCEKALNELFEYLEDNLKDSVFQACENDNSLLDILDLDQDTDNNNLQITDGSKKKGDL